MVEIFYILSVVVIIWLHMFVKIHMPIYLKRINFIICKLCFNYLVKEREGAREERSKPTGHFLVPESINQKKKNIFFQTIKNQGNLNTAWWYFKNYCSYLLDVIMVLRLKKKWVLTFRNTYWSLTDEIMSEIYSKTVHLRGDG